LVEERLRIGLLLLEKCRFHDEVGQPTPDINRVMTDMTNFNGQFNLNKSGFDPMMPGHNTDHAMILRQQPRTAKKIGTGISLPFEVRQEMGLMLEDHQCSLNVALHQYNKHHWMTEGAEGFLSLHHLLEEHIDMVGERVARLGVVPTAHPVTQHELLYIKHEGEGRYTVRDFLRNDLEQELQLQQMLRQTIARAHNLQDFGTVEVLEEVLLDREDLGYHLYSVLEDDTLVRGMEHLLDGKNNIAGDRPMDPSSKLQ
jgi:starvation-inducible DNA-binding protein